MTDRPQINIRLDRDLLSEVDELAKAERVDRSEMARRLLDVGLVARRMELALREYRAERVSAWKAAEIAHVSLYEMLDRIRDEGIPYEPDPEVLDRVDSILGSRRGARAVAESPAPFGREAPSDAEVGIADLREQFRPDVVRWLFVGESSPAGGSHFYRADSNLFRATREAFAAALGNDRVPDGPRFLHFFRDEGAWLVDLADRPVNRLRGRPRSDAVDEGIEGLTRVIADTRPSRIIVVKASITSAVRQAAATAGFAGVIVELPFPVRQWRAAYVRQLADAIGTGSPGRRSRPSGRRDVVIG